MDGILEEKVRQRAYEIWIDLGRGEGQAHDHWIAAERDLMALPAMAAKGSAAEAKPTRAKTAKAAAPKAPAAKPSKARKAPLATASASA